MNELDKLLNGISVYQDVVLAGGTVQGRRRECLERWEAIRPPLPTSGSLIEIGAHFAWFPLRLCEEGADRIGIAWEANVRSAAVARYVLSSHPDRRVALVTWNATTARLQALRNSGETLVVA